MILIKGKGTKIKNRCHTHVRIKINDHTLKQQRSIHHFIKLNAYDHMVVTFTMKQTWTTQEQQE